MMINDDAKKGRNSKSPSKNSNKRTCLLIVATFGGVILLSLIILAFYAMVYIPRRETARKTQVAEINSQNTRVAKAAAFTQEARSRIGTPAITPQITPTTYSIILFCPECAEEGVKINLWKTPDREGIAGSVPHNTTATVIDTAFSKQDVLHYKVKAKGVTGWVSKLFIQK